eukprot:scaffold1862_cov104-Isochrysis_galbana.AAC.1
MRAHHRYDFAPARYPIASPEPVHSALLTSLPVYFYCQSSGSWHGLIPGSFVKKNSDLSTHPIVRTEIWSRGVSFASNAYSSGRGKLSRRGETPRLVQAAEPQGHVCDFGHGSSQILGYARSLCAVVAQRCSTVLN